MILISIPQTDLTVQRKGREYPVLLDPADAARVKVLLNRPSKNGRPHKLTTLGKAPPEGRLYAAIVIDNKAYYLHRILCGIADCKRVVDHINGNTLDNRRENLRLTSHTVNNLNRSCAGVSWDKSKKLWRAEVTCLKRSVRVRKHFKDYAEAQAFSDATRESMIRERINK